MANALYTPGKERILKKEIDWLNDPLKVVLLDAGYTADLADDEFLSDLSAFTIGTPQPLVNRSVSGGAFNADDVTWAKVAPGKTGKSVAIFKDEGTPETSPLLVYIDVISGFPFATNGSDVTVQWDDGQYKIWAL